MRNPMKKNLIVLAAVAAIALAALVLSGRATSLHAQNASSGADGLTATSASSNGGDIVILLHQLTAIHLSHAIFDNAAFQSLKDFSVPVTPEAVSRPNPFAPIGQ